MQNDLHEERDLFRQPAANHIDGVSRRSAGMKPIAQIGPAWQKQAASPVCLSQESHGFGPRDNKKRNPGFAAEGEDVFT